ncbi:DNA-binding transcriptional MerR regulator [Nonomuraea muscovyensis]|uniref:DNA-binding transcriptional MerR regulator n=1 Tax=Nonomuraea muscovyensis TaxID=1124761 RepID=A0A7X0C3N8_9ACTN|nr:hypothetical protein [Nonomuraea muscovyensis]MBB6347603.1 DNA-binding transcriptional MerR regulator [Nonomuraea muscovyensis]
MERDPGSGHRRYDGQGVDRPEALACLRSAGMRIEDMRRYLELLGRGREGAAEQRDLFRRHAERLSGEIERSNERARTVLGRRPRPAAETVVATAESLIARGLVAWSRSARTPGEADS